MTGPKALPSYFVSLPVNEITKQRWTWFWSQACVELYTQHLVILSILFKNVNHKKNV